MWTLVFRREKIIKEIGMVIGTGKKKIYKEKEIWKGVIEKERESERKIDRGERERGIERETDRERER